MRAVIIPAYQPDCNLITIISQLWEAGISMVVVDDGSGSEYESVFQKISDVCILLRHPCNRGKGCAIRTALEYINQEMWDCTVVGIMDADGQHLTEDMLKLLRAAQLCEHTLVLGVREVNGKMPLRSRLGNQAARVLFQMLTGTAVTDTQTGLRAFSAELIPSMLAVGGQRYEYEMNVLTMCVKNQIPIRQINIQTIYHDRANSVSHFRPLADSLRIYKDLIRFSLSSLSGFVLDYLLFAVFMVFLPHQALPVLCANIAARLISAYYNYHMNCRFVFHTRKKPASAVSYFCLAAAILVMNNIILETLVQGLGISVYPAKLLTECILFTVSWLVQQRIIFKKEAHGYEKTVIVDRN